MCIDVAARGLDVKEVQLVVNFDMPNNIEVYIHTLLITHNITLSYKYTRIVV